jgi:ABC-type glutathione transport system ATPase component
MSDRAFDPRPTFNRAVTGLIRVYQDPPDAPDGGWDRLATQRAWRPRIRFSVSAIFKEHMHPVIEVSGVRKPYGKTVAVEEASFEVSQGEIFGLIGPNGARKTTTMECIEGIRKPDRGMIAVLGLDPFRQMYKLQERIGVQLQHSGSLPVGTG